MLFLLIWIVSMVATALVADQKGLHVTGYFLLAVFLGPLALVVVLLAAPKHLPADDRNAVLTSSEAQRQLTELKRLAASLQQRIHTLEQRLPAMDGGEPGADGQPVAAAGEAGASMSNPAAPARPAPEALEVVLGKYWLNRLGVVLFVLGIALFISYTFQYFPAVAKIGIGYAFAAGFFLWGRHLERREEVRKLAWGILGGAWGLLYLTTFAMHYIPATRIVAHPLLAILLLAAVNVAAVVYNLRYQSWVVTAITFLLAFVTAGLGSMDYSAVAYFALLAGSLAWLACRRRWLHLLNYGIVGSYVANLCWAHPLMYDFVAEPGGVSLPVYTFQIEAGMLAVCWAIYAGACYLFAPRGESEQKWLATAQAMNASFFAILGVDAIDRVQPYGYVAVNAKLMFLLLLAAVYGMLAYLCQKRGQSRMIVVNVTLAMTLMALAVLLEVPRLGVAFYWVLETVVLFVLGVYYRERLYRLLAGGLGALVALRVLFVDMDSSMVYAVAGIHVRHDVLLTALSAALFYALGLVSHALKPGKGLTAEDRHVFAGGLPVLATLLATVLCWDAVGGRWLSFSWTMLGTGLMAAGFFGKNRIFRFNGLGVLGLAALRVMFSDLSGVNTITKITAVTVLGALLLEISVVYTKFKVDQS